MGNSQGSSQNASRSEISNQQTPDIANCHQVRGNNTHHAPRNKVQNSSSFRTGRVVVMNNDICLIQNSVKLAKSPKDPNIYSILFTIDTLFETIISAIYYVHDKRDPDLEITYELTSDENYKALLKHLNPAGRMMKIAQNSYTINLSKYNDEEISTHTNFIL